MKGRYEKGRIAVPGTDQKVAKRSARGGAFCTASERTAGAVRDVSFIYVKY